MGAGERRMKRDCFEGKKRRRRPRRTPAFRAMACLTAAGAVLTFASWYLPRLLALPQEAARFGATGIPQGSRVVLSRDPAFFTLALGILTVFFLLVWLVVILRRL